MKKVFIVFLLLGLNVLHAAHRGEIKNCLEFRLEKLQKVQKKSPISEFTWMYREGYKDCIEDVLELLAKKFITKKDYEEFKHLH